MRERLDSGPRWFIAAVAVLTVVGLALRLSHLGSAFIGDEMSTLWIIRNNDLAGTLSTVSSDAEISPPLYFILAWLMSKIGSAPELIRVPSLIAGTVSIPLTYMVGLRTIGRTGGLIAAAVIALNPFMIYYSTDGRGYAVAIALLLGSTLAMLAAARGGRTRWWVAYWGLSCLAMYTHYTSAFVLIAQLVWLLWAYPQARKAALIANIAAAVAFVPWLPSTIADTNSPTIAILSALQGSGFTAKRIAVENWAFGYPYVTPRQLPGVPALLLLVIGIAVAAVAATARTLARRARASGNAARGIRASQGMVLVSTLALATPVGEALASTGGTDLFGARNLNTSSAGLALVIGGVLAAAGPIWGTICTIAVLGGFTIGAVRTLSPEMQMIDFKGAAAAIEREWKPDDVIVDIMAASTTPVPLTPLDIYLPQTHPEFKLGLPTGPPPFLPYQSPIPSSKQLLREAFSKAGSGRVIIIGPPLAITRGKSDIPDVEGASVTLPKKARIQRRQTFTGIINIDLVVIRPHPAASSDAGN